MKEKKEKLKLSVVMESIEMAMDGWTYYYDLKTHTSVCITEDEILDEEDEIRELLDEEWDRFERLPTQYDIHEYRIMEEYIGSLPAGEEKTRLYNAIQRKGAFRRFKDTVANLGRREEWFAFLEKAHIEFAKKWCRNLGYEYEDDLAKNTDDFKSMNNLRSINGKNECKVEFRYANERDAGLILSFIKELAAYEKMSDEVVATEAILKEWIFEKKKAEVIFALEDDKEVGFALFFHNFSTFLGRAGIYLEDLYVKPECRGKGYGKGLLKKLAGIAVERGCGRLEWWCLDWNKPSIDFYLSLGAKAMDEWTVYRITGDTLEEMAREA